jgi:hypothetical protein
MAIHVAGGVYREYCVHPKWNEIYGSAGRAALAIAHMGTSVVLHAFMDDDARGVLAGKGVYLDSFAMRPHAVQGGCRRRSNFDPPCRLNFDPGLVAEIA